MAIDINADFTPSIPDSGVVPTKLPYNPTGSFKFWAQKVIPLVYDDSLSYYEVLCKLVNYLNDVIQNVDNLNDSIDSTNESFETLETYVNTTKDALINAYDELQGYVNTYFDNLDVQQEIDEKLDNMADSGELSDLISPFIPDLVSAWLTSHVNPVGSAVVVDNTLSVSGAAADAKTTGYLKNSLKNVSEMLVNEIKNINYNSGYLMLPVKNGDSITIKRSDGSEFTQTDQLRFYDSTFTYIEYWGVSSAYGNARTFTYNEATPAMFVGITNVGANVIDYDVVLNVDTKIPTKITNLEKNAEKVNEIIKPMNWYTNVNKGATLNTLGDRIPFYAKAGDNITAISADGSDFVNDQLRFYDKNGVMTDSFTLSSLYGKCRNFDYTAATEANYIAIATVTPGDPLNYTVVNNSSVYKKDGKTIIVDASGNGDYTSLTEALFETVDSGFDIIVKPGTYDIVSEYVDLFGESTVNNLSDADTSLNGFQFGAIIRRRKIEFESGAKVVCDWTGHTVDGTHRFSAIRVDYDAEIIGLDLTGTGLFYCIHDDYGFVNKPYTVKYKNCKVEGINLINANCIGGGCKKYSTHIIEDCYFNNNLLDSATVRYHNTNADGAEPRIYVSNSYFNNWFTPRWYGTQTSKMKVFVNNCEARAIYKMAESSGYNVDNVELYKWCNTETNPVT